MWSLVPLTLAGAWPASIASASDDRGVAILYGDSLAWEARHVFSSALSAHPDVDVLDRTFGGTAICDWLDQMADDIDRFQPSVVVVSFSGNNFTSCMRGRSGQPAVADELVERYADDARTAAKIFVDRGVEVVFAGAPLARDGGGERIAAVNDVYRDVAATRAGVEFVDAGASVLADGQWTSTLPCLPSEPCSTGRPVDLDVLADVDPDEPGLNVVRSPDGLHFCPVGPDARAGVTAECPVWSSGAFRFGTALARPVLERLVHANPRDRRAPATTAACASASTRFA